MKSYQTRVGPKSNMTGVLIGIGTFGQTHRENAMEEEDIEVL